MKTMKDMKGKLKPNAMMTAKGTKDHEDRLNSFCMSANQFIHKKNEVFTSFVFFVVKKYSSVKICVYLCPLEVNL